MRISERGQITIPKPLRDQFGMHHNVEVEVTPAAGGVLIRKCAAGEHPVDRVSGTLDRPGQAEHPIDRVSGILDRPGMAGMRIDDVDAYIEDIRGR